MAPIECKFLLENAHRTATTTSGANAVGVAREAWLLEREAHRAATTTSGANAVGVAREAWLLEREAHRTATTTSGANAVGVADKTETATSSVLTIVFVLLVLVLVLVLLVLVLVLVHHWVTQPGTFSGMTSSVWRQNAWWGESTALDPYDIQPRQVNGAPFSVCTQITQPTR